MDIKCILGYEYTWDIKREHPVYVDKRFLEDLSLSMFYGGIYVSHVAYILLYVMLSDLHCSLCELHTWFVSGDTTSM